MGWAWSVCTPGSNTEMHVLDIQPPREEYLRLVSQREHFALHPVSQIGVRSGATGPGRGWATEADQVPGSNTGTKVATQPPQLL